MNKKPIDALMVCPFKKITTVDEGSNVAIYTEKFALCEKNNCMAYSEMMEYCRLTKKEWN